jgi:3-isopropylmalate/(R)-2-methylmalate dehydratase small subunit
MVFATITSPAIPFCRDAVETETIAPEGFDPGDPLTAFRHLRCDRSGVVFPESPFNRPPFAGAAILVSGCDFGVGERYADSARALRTFGITVIVAVSFAPAFAACAAENGFVLLCLTREAAIDLANEAALGEAVTIDLRSQQLTTCHGDRYPFELHAETRLRLARAGASDADAESSSPHIIFAARA